MRVKKKVKVLVLRAAGTNCDLETAYAFNCLGAVGELVHINELKSREKRLLDFQILAIPGGFTYGDDVASGKILANELKYQFQKEIGKFIKGGNLIIGICNGFQILVKSGFLPNLNGGSFKIETTLSLNDSGRFEDRWIYLKKPESSNQKPENKCVWTKGLPEIIYLPVAHGEGKFIPKDEDILNKLKTNDQIVFQYVDPAGKLANYPWNPNGSRENIAGICDPSGRILGMMPHPERHIQPTQHPRWTREGLKKEGDGLAIFKNGVEYAKEHLI